MLVRMNLILKSHVYEYNVQTDHDGLNLKNINPELPTFDGQLDPQIFSIRHQIWIIILIGMICPTREEPDLPR